MFSGCRVSLLQDGILDTSDTRTPGYLMLLNCSLINGQDVHFRCISSPSLKIRTLHVKKLGLQASFEQISLIPSWDLDSSMSAVSSLLLTPPPIIFFPVWLR